MYNYKNLQDKTLVSRVQKKGDSEAASELIRRHENLVYSTIQRFYRKNSNINLKDLMDDKYSIFNQAITTYKSNKKTKFNTWLGCQVYYWILNQNKNADRSKSYENKDIELINNSINNFHYDIDNSVINKELIMSSLSKLDDERIKNVFRMRYIDVDGNKVMSWKSIGKEMNLSITGVINLHNKGKKLIIENIKNLEKTNINE